MHFESVKPLKSISKDKICLRVFSSTPYNIQGFAKKKIAVTFPLFFGVSPPWNSQSPSRFSFIVNDILFDNIKTEGDKKQGASREDGENM